MIEFLSLAILRGNEIDQYSVQACGTGSEEFFEGNVECLKFILLKNPELTVDKYTVKNASNNHNIPLLKFIKTLNPRLISHYCPGDLQEFIANN